MADVVVVGAGAAGLGAALALSRRGHHIRLVERDALAMPTSPDEAFAQWRRRGAPQTRHSHAFLARLRNLLRDRAPEVLADLLSAGAREVHFLRHAPPALHPIEPRPGDEDLVALACRRTTFDWVLRRRALATPGVTLVQGTVTGLLASAGATGAPHVAGVHLGDGSTLPADVVVDASGRRSPLPTWLAAVGAAPVTEAEEDTGIVYSSRFYRLLDPAAHGDHGLIVGDLGYLKYAVFPGDNATLSITFGVHSDDAPLRRVLHAGPFIAVGAALPAVRDWIDPARSEPISDVEVMGGLVNRLRRFVVDGRPLATGVYAVGDSSVCTNPVYGRGCALALVHAELLGDTLAEAGDDPVAAAVAFDAATRRELEPWYRAALAQDHHDRLPADAEDEGVGVGVGSLLRHGQLPAAATDPTVYRAFIRTFNLLAPPHAMMRDREVVAAVLAAWQERGDRPPPPPLGPSRAELLDLLPGTDRAAGAA